MTATVTRLKRERRLRCVPQEPEDAVAEPVDITLALRAEIAARDWSAVHVAGDRQKPVFLPECVRRVWR